MGTLRDVLSVLLLLDNSVVLMFSPPDIGAVFFMVCMQWGSFCNFWAGLRDQGTLVLEGTIAGGTGGLRITNLGGKAPKGHLL